MQFDLFDDTANKILACGDYEAFKKSLAESNCQKCALSKSRTNIVVDRGNPKARIVVIGEGPGENEDIQAKAFVGKAGQLFDKIMNSVGLNTNREMLILNVVKCRPPENRSPYEEEAAACMPFLQRQIALVEPAVILLLGATALKHMDDSRGKSFSMSDEAGKFFKLPAYHNVQFMVLYHPAALLYNASLKPAMWEHAKALRKYLDENKILR